MYQIKAFTSYVLTAVIFLVFSAMGAERQGSPSCQTFSFAVLSDPHVKRQWETWKEDLSTIRDENEKKTSLLSPVDLLLVTGDLDPVEVCYEEFKQIFTNVATQPIFLPVIGNHDCTYPGVHFRYARNVLIPAISNVVCRHVRSCDYYLDFNNIRMIVVDGYTELGQNGVINDAGRQWVEEVIKSTPSSIDHIFIAFHEPAFPRFGHVGGSFDEDPAQRNAFWRMLLQYKARVRAVFVGHTHHYSRLRVLDPAGPAANDPNAFPDEVGGIFQITSGTASTESLNTLIQVRIEGPSAFFRVLQATTGKKQLSEERDKWSFVP